MNWAGLFKMKRAVDPEAKEAMEIAARISKRSDEIMRKLTEYQQSKDPFMTLMADLYNKDQIKKFSQRN